MKTLILFMGLVSLSITHSYAQKKPVDKATAAPFQGTKHFCSFLKPVKFDVTVKGNKVSIIHTYKEYVKKVEGAFINGKLFTNDPAEKTNKRYIGRYYKIGKTYIGINNLEGGIM